jgi:hypothetical protein
MAHAAPPGLSRNWADYEMDDDSSAFQPQIPVRNFRLAPSNPEPSLPTRTEFLSLMSDARTFEYVAGIVKQAGQSHSGEYMTKTLVSSEDFDC